MIDITESKLKVQLDEEALIPSRAYDTDAGLDLYTPYEFMLEAYDSIVINTGVHVQLPYGTVGMIKSKSGLNVNDSITTDGVIDAGYTGAIKVKLYNRSGRAKYFSAGNKIAQLVILPVVIPSGVQIVDKVEGGMRGANGFGSTGA